MAFVYCGLYALVWHKNTRIWCMSVYLENMNYKPGEEYYSSAYESLVTFT